MDQQLNTMVLNMGVDSHFSIDDGIKELIKLYSHMSVNPNNNL